MGVPSEKIQRAKDQIQHGLTYLQNTANISDTLLLDYLLDLAAQITAIRDQAVARAFVASLKKETE